MSLSVLPVFSFKSFIVSGLIGLQSILSLSLCMVLGNVLISFFCMQQSSFPALFIEEAVLPHCIFLHPLSKIRYPQVHGFISGLSILFHWSVFLFLYQYHTVLMSVALQCNLKSGRLIPPAPFFFLQTALATRGLFCFHMNCEIFCSSSVKNTIGNLIGIALNLQIAFGSIVIFTILILPTQEHGISPHLFMSSLISFICVL